MSGQSAAAGGRSLSQFVGEKANSPERDLTDEQEYIIKLAKEQFRYGMDYESNVRKKWKDDMKFAEGDSYNGYQWPDNIKLARDLKNRPCITVNKIKVFNNHVINDSLMNPPSPTIRPTGNGATYESSQVLENIFRNIQYHSRFRNAHKVVSGFQVKLGKGYFRVKTDYVADDSFDQDIFIEAVTDPAMVIMDPDAKQIDRSDARWAFIFDDVQRDQFEQKYPKYKDFNPGNLMFDVDGDWITKDHVRIAEYYWIDEEEDELLYFLNTATGKPETIFKSDCPPQVYRIAKADPATKYRKVLRKQLKWCLFVGSRIADGPHKRPGKFIPVVPAVGEEYIVDGQYDCKGHTRAMLDSQKMYNYFASAAVEFAALQSKTPWIAPVQAIEGQETYWNTANTNDYSVLTYNHLDDEGQPIPPPSRIEPPTQAPLYIQGMQYTDAEMMAVTGQYQAMLGQPSNERSGKAITERQQKGDVATYHYIDGMAVAIRQLGRIVVEMIPEIYDTKRVVFMQGADGKSLQVEIDPQAAQAYQQELNHLGQVAKHILNPGIGRYEVQCDVGPDFGTKREQAVEALSTIITQAPALTSAIGDILIRNMDFPEADKAAERLERLVPPQAKGTGPSQAEMALQQQVKALTQTVSKLFEENVLNKIRLKGKDEGRDIEAFDAETKRMAALSKIFPTADPEGTRAIIHQMVQESLALNLSGFGGQERQDTSPTGGQGQGGPSGATQALFQGQGPAQGQGAPQAQGAD